VHLDAMAAGLPIVTTDVSGISSLITNGENGMIVPEGSTQGMVDALRALVTTPAMRQRLIHGGYATARAHTLERQAASLMQIVAAEFDLAIRRPDAA
jgi:glycosyltransferase involved in cell wall biosynthesis